MCARLDVPTKQERECAFVKTSRYNIAIFCWQQALAIDTTIISLKTNFFNGCSYLAWQFTLHTGKTTTTRVIIQILYVLLKINTPLNGNVVIILSLFNVAPLKLSFEMVSWSYPLLLLLSPAVYLSYWQFSLTVMSSVWYTQISRGVFSAIHGRRSNWAALLSMGWLLRLIVFVRSRWVDPIVVVGVFIFVLRILIF